MSRGAGVGSLKIPQIFHFSVPMSATAEQREVIEAARKLHPHWKIMVWDDSTPIPGARLARYLDRARSGAQRADLIRLDAVYAYGGVYLDADVRALKSFDALTENFGFFICSEDGENLTNAVFGATAAHPALDAIIGFLEANEPNWSLAPNVTTGPILFANILGWRSDVDILPRETFYPYSPNEKAEGTIHRLSYGEHLWNYSWKGHGDSPFPPPLSVKVRARRLVIGAIRPVVTAAFRWWRRAAQAAETNATASTLPRFPLGAYPCVDEVVARTVHGHMLVLDGRDLSITPGLIQRGYHEWPEEAFVRRTLRGGDWFIDVGANVGVFTSVAAGQCGRLGRVFAFEPNPGPRALLYKSAVLNWHHDRIRVCDVALADTAGTATLSYNPHRLGDAQVDAAEKAAPPFKRTGEFLERREIDISTCRLDDLIPVDLPIKIMKIDAEGHEPKVLEGSERLLTNRAFDYILLEASIELFPGNWSRMLENLRRLVALGYNAGTLDAEGNLLKSASLEGALHQKGGGKTLVFSAT